MKKRTKGILKKIVLSVLVFAVTAAVSFHFSGNTTAGQELRVAVSVGLAFLMAAVVWVCSGSDFDSEEDDD